MNKIHFFSCRLKKIKNFMIFIWKFRIPARHVSVYLAMVWSCISSQQSTKVKMIHLDLKILKVPKIWATSIMKWMDLISKCWSKLIVVIIEFPLKSSLIDQFNLIVTQRTVSIASSFPGSPSQLNSWKNGWNWATESMGIPRFRIAGGRTRCTNSGWRSSSNLAIYRSKFPNSG